MGDHAVVIAGGGPTGLMLAGELTLAGVDVLIVERRLTQELDGSRAGGLHSRTIEVLDQRGIAERFLEAGQVMQTTGYAYNSLDISDFPTRHNYGLALWQSEFERILAGWVLDDLGAPILRGREVAGLSQDEDGVDIDLSDGGSLRADYVVGCDGGRSVVRKAAGIEFPGLDPSTSWMIAEVEMDEQPEFGFRRNSVGQHAIGRRQEHEPIRLVLTEREIEHDGDPTIEDLRDELVSVYGTDFGLRSAAWISRFTDMSRQAASYRSGRVLLAGDAAHIHPPQGGQGLNTGVQDAVNLGWKLAQVVRGVSPTGLLDTYHAERHPIGARVLRHTMAQVALGTPNDRHQALRDDVAEMLSTEDTRRRFAGALSGLTIQYDLGEGHPLLGRRMPDLDLQTSAGQTRVFTLLHDARPVLLVLAGAEREADVSGWTDRVRRIDASCGGAWVLPLLGEVAAPEAVLIRPDGYVAWTGTIGDSGLPGALTTWFGPPRSGVSGGSRSQAAPNT